MYNSYANRNAPGEQIPSGVLQQVMRADHPQGQLSQPASAGYGFSSQGASYFGGLQQVMQADRQAPMGGAQQYRNTQQYGASAPSYGASYAIAQQRGQAYGQGVNASALSSVMQADRVATGGTSYANYSAGNSHQAQSVNLQQVMQAARPAQMQPQFSSGSFYSSASPSGHAYGGITQPQHQQVQQVAVQPIATQQIPMQQNVAQQVSAAPGLSQVMQADHTNYATGPSRSNYNY